MVRGAVECSLSSALACIDQNSAGRLGVKSIPATLGQVRLAEENRNVFLIHQKTRGHWRSE
jgi:hypothetical protein